MNMVAPNGDFALSRLERVIYGPGKVDALKDEMDRRQLRRALVVTTEAVAELPILKAVKQALAPHCVGVFAGVVQHVPRSSVNALVADIKKLNADCVVSFGGGSPIDSCKAALGHLTFREMVHIAVPTTLSAAEFTQVGGVTDDETRIKNPATDLRAMPRTVIADPALALGTPDWLWVTTGMRALDHAIEGAYSVRHQPISDALAAQAIALLVEHLPGSICPDQDERLAHRGHCQMASWFSIYGATNTGFGLSHLMGHQIGPRWNIPHGVTSCITLPHVMRFMAEFAADRFGPIAAGYGIPFDRANPKPAALACADRTEQFIAQFDVPRTLGALNVPRNEIGEIVAPIVHELARNNPGRAVTETDVLALLEACY